MILLTILITLLAGAAAQNRVVEITTTNVQLVLRTVGKLHLLLHDPNCQHSRDYAQKFLEVKTPLQMGIADCRQEKELCSHLNVTHFPTLVQLTNNTLTILDEQWFLLGEGLVQEDDPKVILNSIVGRLRGESGWAAVVLQEEGLPVLERVQKSAHNEVFYVAPPSRLYDHLSAMVGRKFGCWIIAHKEGQLKKYYCGHGYKSDELLKYVQNFEKGKLVSHTFTRETNLTHLARNDLAQIIKQNYAVKKCKLVYFHSKHCEHCSLSDIKRIETVLSSLKLKDKIQVQIFDLDHEELPFNFKLTRIPELVEFCNFEMHHFGDVFNLENLTRFLGRPRNYLNPERMEAAKKKAEVIQPQPPRQQAEERLQL